MEVQYATADLKRLAEEASFNGGYAQAVVKAYRKRMQLILNAVDERDLYAFKSLHFEKLKGNRSGQHSLRLNDQWRLIVELVSSEPKNIVRVLSIADYH